MTGAGFSLIINDTKNETKMKKAIIVTLALTGILAGMPSFAESVSAPLTASASVTAGDAIMAKIEKANSTMKTVQCKFHQVRTIKASGKKNMADGNLYFNVDGRLAMRFTAPEGEYIISSGSKFYVHRGPKNAVFDITKNATVANMSGTLIGCVKGNPAEVAKRSDYKIEVAENAEGYVVTLTTDNAARRGYSKIVLTYRKSDCILVKMVMDEPSGISTTYEMSDIKKNASFPDSVFVVPARQGSAK